MAEPYYADDLVTLWLGDCREVTAWFEKPALGLSRLVRLPGAESGQRGWPTPSLAGDAA